MVSAPGRRDDIMLKIHARVEVVDMGFVLDGKPSPCHLWTGPHSGTGRGGGYGRMHLSGQTVAVHIVVFTHFYGYVPGKKQIDHKCSNRTCCNPAHLQMVTHKQNQRLRDKRAGAKKA
ncbi:hypothetical protein SKUL_64 [Pseudomonas phage Skulduggery]|uniref:HNH nuclease domain-containing protein n=1 Tax=Pseudomonas phage Skulduggery TaxID=2006671 RepID=A0A1Y0SZF8_9CAUD|nr:HNH endonuclease [Pseudomonas phage Skulduggery]ARV77163.1 hypothetical protein SKUL_64 [Pseudomonas phage Skulduggery]